MHTSILKLYKRIRSNLLFYSATDAGFTLVELLVSLALFTIVVIAAVGSLYTVNQASVNVSAMRTVLDNLNFANESMGRTIRTGANITCGGPGSHTTNNCAFGSTQGSAEIALESTLPGDQPEIDYKWVLVARNGKNNGEIDKCVVENGVEKNCVSITAPEINITKFAFYVDGADTGDGKQPSVITMMQGQATADSKNVSPFAIQTYISVRAGE